MCGMKELKMAFIVKGWIAFTLAYINLQPGLDVDVS